MGFEVGQVGLVELPLVGGFSDPPGVLDQSGLVG